MAKTSWNAARILFLGTGGFAVPSLRALLDAGAPVLALVTQPDKPAGRGHALRPPPTKVLALERGLPVHQPPRVKAPEAFEIIRNLAPDLMVVVAYGQILPKSILDVPRWGVINVHGSLLPAYRGAAPLQWSLVRGETTTGVTTMLMDEGMDTGPTLLKRALSIDSHDTSETLERKLAPLGAELLVETLAGWLEGRIHAEPQDNAKASLAPRIKKEDARVDWRLTATEIDRRVRGFNPWPVAHVERAKIWRAEVGPDRPGAPGEILAVEREAILVSCGAGTTLRLLEVQAEGKRRMSAAEFARGARLAPGRLF